MQVLLLEDNPFDADLIRRALRRHAPEIQVTHAKDVALALAWLRSDEHFDLILSDLHLIDGDGFSVLMHVLRHNLPVPVVFMTGSGDETRVVAALKAGAVCK